MDKAKHPIKNYWNRRSGTYGLDVEKSAHSARTWESVLMELVADCPGRRALDVGTGTGQFALYLAANGFEVTGIDLSEKMIAQARRNARREGQEIDFQVGDAEHLILADNSFDVVVSRNLLWTLPRPEQALKEWQRVLRPGGRLVLSDGYWMNSTWRQLPGLLYRALKEKLALKSRQSLRFFWDYSKVRKALPYYTGIKAEEAAALLKKTAFKDVGCYDTACFQEHPYGFAAVRSGAPPFFIAYAGV